MRADRLIAILLLLQHRQQVTASEVALELEVSERTARRDLEALSNAGVPVYAVPGRGGGWRLLGGARTDLSGLTASEARALFLVAGPASTATPSVKAALRKLLRALPAPFREQAEAAASSVVVDPRHWGSNLPEPRPPRFLDELHDAVIRGVQVRLDYVDRWGRRDRADRAPTGHRRQEAHVVPALPHRRWTTDLPDRPRVLSRVDRRRRRTTQGFDLAASWREIADEVDRQRTPLEAEATCAPDGLGLLRRVFGGRLDVGGSRPDGRIEIVIRGRDEFALAGELAWLIDWVEVTGPQGVRDHLASIGGALVARYS